MSATKLGMGARRIDPEPNPPRPEIVLQIRLDPAPLLEALRGAARSDVVAELETLLTQEDAARFCRCSVRHFRRLRDEGLPTLWLGESPRFERDAVLAWLRSRSVK
jgi:hypothetical protein